MIKSYDIFVPLGRGCHSAMMLTRYNLRFCSYPFDWLLDMDKDNIGISSRINLFNNFDGFLDKSNLEFHYNLSSEDENNYLVNDLKYRFSIYHDFRKTKKDKENIVLTRFKYKRRYNRLLNHLKIASSVCFVNMTNTWDHMNECFEEPQISEIEKFSEQLIEQYPNTNFDFIIFCHDQTLKKDELIEKTFKISTGNVFLYYSNHTLCASQEKLSDILSIKEVLSKLKLSEKHLIDFK